ncbi:hypothetical protein Syun_028377 [Stephania yunnanensis]|uniref:Uncharacterized protein n=1 Tax=Stephania yunnanensis TaxID=152371 RepID=A0AAP0HR24_9MAGN
MGDVSKWRRLDLKVSFLDDVMFKIVSVFEALILVSALCFFYCFCGCHFSVTVTDDLFFNWDLVRTRKRQSDKMEEETVRQDGRMSPPRGVVALHQKDVVFIRGVVALIRDDVAPARGLFTSSLRGCFGL